MFGTMKNGASAYANVGVETGVLAASPHKLIVMLFDGAMVAVGSAMRQMEANEIAAKGKSISKAITIIENGLRASLDLNAGGEIAANLDALYDYMCARLLSANRDNDLSMLQEVNRLLGELKGAWEAIGVAPAPQAPRSAIYDTAAPAAVLTRV
jgi:flagellar protein FliS